jgi:hypothetical protein
MFGRKKSAVETWFDWFKRYQDREAPVAVNPTRTVPTLERCRELIGKAAADSGLTPGEEEELDDAVSDLKPLTRPDALFAIKELRRLRSIEGFLGSDPTARLKELEAMAQDAQARLDAAELEIKHAREAYTAAAGRCSDFVGTIAERHRVMANPVLFAPAREALDPRRLMLFRSEYNR